MVRATDSFGKAVDSFDRSSIADTLSQYKEQLAEMRRRFPREEWTSMALEKYALGHPKAEESFCRWCEFKATAIGSIKGGSAHKLIIFKRKSKDGWHFPSQFSDVETAWENLRAGYVQSLELATQDKWTEIESLIQMQHGPAIATKMLHIYFPQDVLSVFSNQHLRHFLAKLGEPAEADSTLALNRRLLRLLQTHSDVRDWSTKELERFLYFWADPRESRRVLKIAPGENARFWDQCLASGYISVGWGNVGDLSLYESKEEFKAEFRKQTNYKTKSKASAKANEVWSLRELEAGDLVVANKGISEILAVGEVVEPGYVFRENANEHNHTVTVRWDTSYAKEIPPQPHWATVTVAKITPQLQDIILSKTAQSSATLEGVKPTADETIDRIARALERRKQAILYGPPGTGKTFHARRFAVWWLLKRGGRTDAAEVLADKTRFEVEEQSLSVLHPNYRVGLLTRVTFHASYGYEDFIEGFRPADVDGAGIALRLDDGLFKRVCVAAAANPGQDYLVLIDEINRANIAKVMGELLTLLEADKRGLAVILPQSKKLFSIPKNVFLLGTMNTADRSIKLLDTALRRRFAFLEMMPDLDLLAGAAVGELELDDFLNGLNIAIERIEGREKQIGHSYLLRDDGRPVATLDEMGARFREEILPLLQEYSYDDAKVLGEILGSELVDSISGLKLDVVEDDAQLVDALARRFASPAQG
jgi:5-methylcytosine-specific restriction enzyme B